MHRHRMCAITIDESKTTSLKCAMIACDGALSKPLKIGMETGFSAYF
jgi:hypothetical protein